MSSFLTHHGALVALFGAACAIVYGAVTARQLLALSPGNERMRSISAAVQEGARAYLNRQYTTIAIVGVVWNDPSVGTTSLMFCSPKKCRSPRKALVPPKAQVKPTMIQVTLTIAMAAKFCINMPRTCLTRTMPP